MRRSRTCAGPTSRARRPGASPAARRCSPIATAARRPRSLSGRSWSAHARDRPNSTLRDGAGAVGARGQVATSDAGSSIAANGVSVAVPQVPAAAVRRAGRPGARHHRAAQRGARGPGRPRVPLLRPARHGQDHHRAHPRQGAQLPEPRPTTASRAASARTAWRSRPAPSSTCSSSTPRRTAASTTPATCSSGIAFRSATGGKKVYILDEVHMLTDAASNTLLKTLEEPPDHVVFVLATTNPEKVLPTIRSRTQHFEFSLYSTEQIAAHLADICAREGVDADRRRSRSSPAPVRVGARRAVAARPGARARHRAPRRGRGRRAVRRLAVRAAGRRSSRRSPRVTRPTVLVELGALLDAGHEPRRVAEDLLRAARDAFLLDGRCRSRVRSTAPEEEQTALRELGDGARQRRPSSA